jgi:uncharacterized protein
MTEHNTRDISNLPVLHAGPAFEVKFAGAPAEAGTLTGYLSAYGPPADSYSDIIQAGAFDQTLAEHRSQGSALPMLWAHDMARPCGKWTSFKSDEYGLHATGMLSLATEAGKQAHEHLKAGDVSSLSIGYLVPNDGFRWQKDGTRLLTRIELLEASIVPVGANRRARITSIKSFQSLQTQRDFERWLHDEAGLSRSAAVKVASKGWNALTGRPEDEEKFDALARRLDAALTDIRSFKLPNRY